jgi:hypothetical protein
MIDLNTTSIAPTLDDKDRVDQALGEQGKKVYQRYKISFTALNVCVIFSCGW